MSDARAGRVSVGDVVRLKSGGPVMTVEATVGDGAAICCWFTHGLQRYNATFASETLMACDAPETWPAGKEENG
ncbi:YodC family protein [Sulfitobacter sp. SK011]|jgi:uncharacterized protein YodC (DUF2158 family)|uniref:YodC family protein n=1 Tax=Sulfitobacter sp. SK011 TaxID=1389004 RepID=UPI000E0AD870|nr:DUF2158 domain-containing protein [Sulfitobacter sp. SK011]AXI42835.1 DUF2158 domain-containing protein [Sulfitobacter sp. SK011]